MRRLLEPAVLLRILAPLVLLPVLGLAARPHALSDLMRQAGRARHFGSRSSLAAQLVQIAEFQPWRLELWEQAGLYALQGGDNETALRWLQQAEAAGRLSPTGYLYLGDAFSQAGDIESARGAWDAARSGVDAWEVQRHLLDLNQHAGDIDAVISNLQTLLDLRPTDVALRYRLGLHLAARQPEAALSHLAQVADLDASLKAQAEALISAIRTAQLQGDSAYTLLEAGRALASSGEWVLAAEAFHGAIQAAPDYAEAWAYLGEARQQTAVRGQGATATSLKAVGGQPSTGDASHNGLAELEKALALDPRSLAANTLLALYWQRQGDHEQAVEVLQAVTGYYPENYTLQAELGGALARTGELEDALQAYQKGVELAPRQAEPWRLLADFSVRYEYLLDEVGLPAARRAAMIAPDDPANSDVLGQALLLQGDLASAGRSFQRAVDLEPGYALAKVHLGLAYILQGDSRRAYRIWTAVSATIPGTPAAELAQRLLKNYYP